MINPVSLAFPLNIYAQTLRLEYGAVEHLHFGIFDNAASTVGDYPRAQAAAQNALITLLEPAPARVLEMGYGSGALARTLADKGYQVSAVTSSAEEFRSTAHEQTQGLEFIHSDLESFHPTQGFDVLLLQQSAQYLDPLQLFRIANRCLVSGGQLLLAEEFLLDDSLGEAEARPLLTSFLQLAERCGFSTQRQRELGRQVAPGLLSFASLLSKHEAALVATTGATLQNVHDLQRALCVMAKKYKEARLGYTLVDLRRSEQSGPINEFGNIQAFSVEEVSPLFESSFDTRFDPAIWQWKYGDGRGRAVSVHRNGTLVAHYGGAPRAILYFSQASKAIQICDVMVLPEHRSFVGRDTLFFKSAATFLEQQVGNGAEHLLGFGFPNERVLRVAKRLGLYDVTDTFVELHYPLPSAAQNDACIALENVDPSSVQDRAIIEALWAQMALDFEGHIIGVRDWEYLHYRYFSHPFYLRGEYECLALRDTAQKRVIAIVFLKPHEGGRLVMDIVGPIADFERTLNMLRAHIAKQGLALRCRVTSAHAHRLSQPGVQQHALGIEIPCNIWTRGPSAEQLRGAWWLTAGDMDFL